MRRADDAAIASIDAAIKKADYPKAFENIGALRPVVAAFFDKAIAPSELEFHFEDSFVCGNEEANVGHILITAAGYRVRADGVFTYRVDDDGKIVALRAYWELDRATATAVKV